MSNKIIQRTKPVQIGVNATVTFDASSVDGFIPYTSGTITITTFFGTVIVNALPVTAGSAVPLPLAFPDSSQSATIVAAGGASGILCI